MHETSQLESKPCDSTLIAVAKPQPDLTDTEPLETTFRGDTLRLDWSAERMSVTAGDVSQSAERDHPARTRPALAGFAELAWDPGRRGWRLKPRIGRISLAASLMAIAMYLSLAAAMYAQNIWFRNCRETSYAQMCLFIFPDRIPLTRLVWVPDFIHRHCENARALHRAKLARVLVEKSKVDLANKNWAGFFAAVFGATTMDPGSIEARRMAVQALLALGRDDDAMEALDQGLSTMGANPDYVRLYVNAGLSRQCYARIVTSAENQLKSAGMPDAVRQAWVLGAAHAYFKRGDFSRCEAVLNDRLVEKAMDAFLLRFRIRRELGKSTEALRMISQAVLGNPGATGLVEEQVSLLRAMGDDSGARSAVSLALLRDPGSSELKLCYIRLMDPVLNKGQMGDLVADYRKTFSKSTQAMLALGAVAVEKGMIDLNDSLVKEAQASGSEAVHLFYLMYIESHLSARHYAEAVRLVDALFLNNPPWLESHRLDFDSLRMVAHFALGNFDTGEIALKRVAYSKDILEPKFMGVVAKRLLDAGRKTEALRVAELCRFRNPDSVSALETMVRLHVEAGGLPETPQRLAELLKILRPERNLLERARIILAGDAYIFEPDREAILNQIDALISA